ncbi:GATA transcription factor 18 [Euphorbia peplus]|nr:GATA transcription factor 18 [Euphorbia peplus]
MMHRCSSSSHGNMMDQCSCGLYQTNSFTMLFQADHHHHMYPFPSSSSSVDCTLSLGTPSTRLCEDQELRHETHHRPSSSSSSSFCWDILQTHKNTSPYPSSQTHHKTTRPTNHPNNNNNSNADPLLARRCANCDTTSTPLWRNGPRGPKSLCNACGIRFKKEERRATAANGNGNGSSNGSSSSSGTMMDQQNYYGYTQTSAAQKLPCYYSPAGNNEFRFIEESDHHHHHHRDSDSTSAIPFLSWRLNVTDRPSLVHDFTR